MLNQYIQNQGILFENHADIQIHDYLALIFHLFPLKLGCVKIGSHTVKENLSQGG